MSVTISGTGVFTPSQKISNKELVQSYNKYADSHNEKHKIEISEGLIKELTLSSVCLLYTSPSPRD